MLWYVSGATLAKLRNAVSVCKCPNSTSTGVVNAVTAGFVASDGCRLAPVTNASKNSTPTPFGGVSPRVKVMGTALLGVICWFIEPPQATRNRQLTTASANTKFRRIGIYLQLFDSFS